MHTAQQSTIISQRRRSLLLLTLIDALLPGSLQAQTRNRTLYNETFARAVVGRDNYIHAAELARTSLQWDAVLGTQIHRIKLTYTRIITSHYRQQGKNGRLGRHHKVPPSVRHGLHIKVIRMPDCRRP